MKLIRFILVLILSFPLYAQEEDMPDHDIALFSLNAIKSDAGLRFSVSDAVTITDAKGYDNQPMFVDETTLYYTRMEDVNADIWLWKNGKRSKITSTLESEYSPTPMPGKAGTLSTVRVEHDNTQRLWQINPDGSFQLLYRDIKPVGYHAWQGQNIGFFILGEPHAFYVLKAGSQQLLKVDENIGRCLKSVPRSNKVSYTKDIEGQHQLISYDFESGQTTQLLNLPQGVQDYAWYSEDIVISSYDGELMWRNLQNGKSWSPVQNTTTLALNKISRLAISPGAKSIAVVFEK